VEDTPPTIGWQTCNLAGASCGNVVDNVQNAMDYSYCNKMFTYGQKARMQACLNSPIAQRNNLWQPANLIATGVAVPTDFCRTDFVSDKSAVCPNAGNTITFTNTSFFGTPDSLRWIFSGGIPSTSAATNPVISYSSSGVYPVSLSVFQGGLEHSITKPNFISVLSDAGTNYPYAESFELTSGLNGPDWFEYSFDTLNRWQITSAAAYSGQKSVFLPINLSGATQVNLAFKYAFAGKDSVFGDKLQVYFTKNCTTSWALRLSLANSALATSPPQQTNFVPNSELQWKKVSLNIPTSYFAQGFRFKFVFTSGGGNNFYLDDVNLDVAAGLEETNVGHLNLNLFPNPTDNDFRVDFELAKGALVGVSVRNLVGQTVFEQAAKYLNAGNQSFSINTKNLPSGLYLLKLETEGGGVVKHFSVNR
jgi:PKD repeat protein